MSDPYQPSLLEPTWRCNLCNGRGVETDPETGQARRCRMCYGARVLEWDPEDLSEVPF